MSVYGGSKWMWRTRLLRRAARPPVVWLRHRKLEPADVAVAAYPKSGSTWLAFMLAELATGEDVDFVSAQGIIPDVRDCPGAPRLVPGGGRLIRTHESARNEYARAIFIVRDPRDVVVSYYHYRQWLGEFSGTMTEFVRLFVRGRVDNYGVWGPSVASWLDRPGESILVVRFEDMRADTERELKRASGFLGWEVSDDQVRQAVHNNRLEAMKLKEQANRAALFASTAESGGFVRSGTGGWVESCPRPRGRAIDCTLVRSGHGAPGVPRAVVEAAARGAISGPSLVIRAGARDQASTVTPPSV